MEEIQPILNQSFLGNSINSYLWFLGIILAGLLFKKFLSKILTRLLFKVIKKYSAGVDLNQFIELLTKPVSIFILLLTFYLAFDRLEFPAHWNLVPAEKFGFRMIIFRLFQISIVFSLTWIILRIVDFFSLVLSYKASLTESKTDDQLVPFIKEALKIIIIIFSFIFVLSAIFHLNITSLIAGLGIGGLAIALAAKESLENLLGSFTIFFDQPFVIGDLVQVGSITGHVEKIGFRSTRIRTLEKSFVTVPNKKMVDAELDNLTLRTQRRVQFNLGLTYTTSAEQLKQITKEIKALINSHPHTDHNDWRVFFSNFAPSSLELFVSYYVNTTISEIFFEVKEEINFKIMDIINKNGASLAYPTSTVYIHKTDE